jgi:DNA-binding PadR family transcriptional regulator
MKDKKLVILNLLRQKEMHGYQLAESLKSYTGLATGLKRSSIYDLLNRMAMDGWIGYREEREGNRPTRRVYAITNAGETAFQNLLRERLGEYPMPELPAVASLGLLHHLPTEEAVALLQARRIRVEEIIREMDAVVQEGQSDLVRLGEIYMQNFLTTEVAWLDEVIRSLST